MSAIEKTWVLSYFEMKLLIRSRMRLLAVLAMPVVAAVFFGLAEHAAYGLFLILPISSLFILQPALSIEYLLLPYPYIARMLAVLPVLAVQAALYAGTAALLEPRMIGIGILASAIVTSLIVSVAACWKR